VQVIVAVDGPAGSGKSSVCRGVAASTDMRYLDTGAMYRAMTWAVLDAGADPNDEQQVRAVAESAVLVSSTDPLNPAIAVNGHDVSDPIRGAEVTAAVSAVSAVPKVRAILVDQQRAVVADAQRENVGIVVEGRDIGSVVLPDADLKIFLTADPVERARRRAAENHGDKAAQHVEQTKDAILERDRRDTGRAVSPLTMADDAVELDTTHLSLDEVISAVVQHIRDCQPK